MAMLIMTAVVGVAISLSILIVRQFQLSSNLDHSLVALYAAESGFEKGLSIIKKNRNDITKDITDADSSLDISNMPLDVLTTANWTSSGSVDEYYLSDSLNQNQSLSLDLKKAGSVELTWDDDCENSSWLRIGFIAWNDSMTVGPVPPSYFKDGVGEEPWPLVACGSSEGNCSVVKNFPDENLNYTVTVTPIACNVSNLKVKAYDDFDPSTNVDADPINIGNRINLKSVGKYQGSQIAVSANLPYRLPPQGIFNFAIFSESTLEKK